MADRFVNVRIQSMNGVNLNHFQFEYDLTWMAFFQDSAGRTYTRYGGREDHDSESHLNKESLLRVMQQVLSLHEDGKIQPDSRYEPVASAIRTPIDIPPMKTMMSRRKESCIHCHDVKAATLRNQRELGQLKKDMVFTYPAPSRLGIHVDPKIQDRVGRVNDGSPANMAGIRRGDVIRTIDKHRVLTFADMTRVLELAPKTGSLELSWERDEKQMSALVQLPDGWRSNKDPSWRSTTGNVGPLSGIWGKRATRQQRKQLNLEDDVLAMRVTYIWAAWARDAGIKNGDYILALDGHNSDMTIRQFQAYLHLNKNWGDRVAVDVRRGGKNLTLRFHFPDSPPK